LPKLPGISHQQAIKAFEKFGFRIVRQGKHSVLTDGKRVVTIPRHDPINAYTLGSIITGAGMTVEEFKNLLK